MIERAINSSPSLRNKKDLIEQFVDSVSNEAKVDAQWDAFVAAKRVEELDRIIADERLDAAATQSFVDDAFRDGAIPIAGVAITRIKLLRDGSYPIRAARAVGDALKY